MPSFYLIFAAVIPFLICFIFLMIKTKKVGQLLEQRANLEEKNTFLSDQLNKEMEISDKRSNQIFSLLNTGKFNFIELPQGASGDLPDGASPVQAVRKQENQS